jgi:hypothetical protein
VLPAYEHRLAERILVEEDVQRILAAEPEPRNQALLRLLYAAGLRVSEACNLRWRNLHARGDAGQITVFGKNGRTRAVPLPAEIWTELVSRRGAAAAADAVFPSRSGKALDRGRVRVIVRQAAQRAGVAESVSPHWLRHAHASHALDRGAPVHLVQATLGHSTVATTSRYLHARPGDSSARFLALGTIPSESASSALPLAPAGVMNVLTAGTPAKGETSMTTKIAESQGKPQAAEPKAPRKATGGAQKPRVAPGKGKATKKGHLGREGAPRPQTGGNGDTDRPPRQQDVSRAGPAPAARRRDTGRTDGRARLAGALCRRPDYADLCW